MTRLTARRKRITVLALLGILVGMGALTASAVPLYRLFCQVTGYAGTTGVARALPAVPSARTITVRFNTDKARDLPWRFRPLQRSIVVHLGETAIAYFEAENLGEAPITGSATYNVTPFKVGSYFDKIDCFCFTEQTLAPGERRSMPVTFFVDPAIADDPNAAEVTTITLSYTFFRRPAPSAAGAS